MRVCRRGYSRRDDEPKLDPPPMAGGASKDGFDVDKFYQQFYDRRVEGGGEGNSDSDVSSLSTDLSLPTLPCTSPVDIAPA